MNLVPSSHTHPPSEMQEGNYSLSSPPFLLTCQHPNLTSLGSFPRHIQVVATFLLNRLTHQANWQVQVHAGVFLKLIALGFGLGSQTDPDECQGHLRLYHLIIHAAGHQHWSASSGYTRGYLERLVHRGHLKSSCSTVHPSPPNTPCHDEVQHRCQRGCPALGL